MPVADRQWPVRGQRAAGLVFDQTHNGAWDRAKRASHSPSRQPGRRLAGTRPASRGFDLRSNAQRVGKRMRVLRIHNTHSLFSISHGRPRALSIYPSFATFVSPRVFRVHQRISVSWGDAVRESFIYGKPYFLGGIYEGGTESARVGPLSRCP